MLRSGIRFVGLMACLTVAQTGCGTEAEIPVLFEAKLDEATFKLHITVHPGLSEGQSLHVGVRNGPVGVLDCSRMPPTMQRIDSNVLGTGFDGAGQRFEGPFVDPAIFQLPYDPSWLDIVPTLVKSNEIRARVSFVPRRRAQRPDRQCTL